MREIGMAGIGRIKGRGGPSVCSAKVPMKMVAADMVGRPDPWPPSCPWEGALLGWDERDFRDERDRDGRDRKDKRESRRPVERGATVR
jgi:hypothetical protein